MENFSLETDQEGVKDFRGMRREYRSRHGQDGSDPKETGRSHPITIQFTAEIAADDYSPNQARIVHLVNGAWVPSGETLEVRNLTGGAVAAASTQVAVPGVDHLGYAVIGGGGPGSGGGSDCCDCVSVVPNLVHPGGFDSVTQWKVKLTSSITVPTSDAIGTAQMPPGEYVLDWDSGSSTWILDSAAAVVVRDAANNAVTPSAVHADWSFVWTAGASLVLELDMDATL